MLKYKNIYQNQRHGTNYTEEDHTQTLTEQDLDSFLEEEKNKYEGEPWNKLNKTDKLKKLYVFAEKYVNDNSIIEEKKSMEKFLKVSLENKKITKIKNKKYDKISGKITEITGLKYDDSNKKFSIKGGEGHVSTSKHLGTPKKSKQKIKKTMKNSPTRSEK